MEEAEVLLEHLHETSTRNRATYSRHLDFIGGPEHCDPRRPRSDSLDFSPDDVNEAMMNQIEASDQWSYYQAKSIKASVLDAKMPLVGTPNESDPSIARSLRERAGRNQIGGRAQGSRGEVKLSQARNVRRRDHVPDRDCRRGDLGAHKKTPALDCKPTFRGSRLRLSRPRRDHKVGAIDVVGIVDFGGTR